MLKQIPSSNKYKGMQGFSMIELIIVLLIIAIMSSFAIFYLTAHQKLYEADHEALQIVDVLQEARQRSLTQRETMRVQIDLTNNVVRLIDENKTGVADDSVIRTISLQPNEKVKVENRPSNIRTNPPEPVPVPSAQFNLSSYPESTGNNVCTIRFQSDGTVVDEGTDASGSGAVSTGVTLYIWSPDEEDTSNSKIARAITVLGSSGAIRLWVYEPEPTGNNPNWIDSRRTSSFGA